MARSASSKLASTIRVALLAIALFAAGVLGQAPSTGPAMGANSTTNTTAPAPAGPTAGRATLTGFWLNLRLNEAVYWIWGACSVVVWISVAVDFVAAAQEKKFVKAITGKGNNVRKLEVALPTA